MAASTAGQGGRSNPPPRFSGRLRAQGTLVVLLGLLAGPRAPGEAQDRPPIFPARTDVVSVDVVVVDPTGRPVERLTRDDFTLLEDGRPQRITVFEGVTPSALPPPPPLRISINTGRVDRPDGQSFFVVFDDINISQFSTRRAREAVNQFLDRALAPGDRVSIATGSGGWTWSGTLPDDREQLKAFVERLQGERRLDTTAARLWDHEAMGIALGRDSQALAQVARRYYENNLLPEAYPGDRELREALQVSPGLALIQARARQEYTEATSRIRTSLGTLERLSLALGQTRGRKTVLLVSEGFIMDASNTAFRTFLQAARNGNVAVHFVDVSPPEGAVGGPGMAGGTAESARSVEDRDATRALAMAARESDGARSIASDTGGTTVTGSRLAEGLARIVAEGRSYYLLGYTSTNTRRDGRFRKIEVKVTRPGVEVRARGGYYAPGERDASPPSQDRLDPSVRAALDAPFGSPGIPMRAVTYALGAQPEGSIAVLLIAEADITTLGLRESRGVYSAKLDSFVVVRDWDRGIVKTDERLVEADLPPAIFQQTLRTGLPIRRELELAAGRYEASVVLRDRASGFVGSVRHEFEVPAATGLRISTPVLTDTIQPGPNGQAGRTIPIARRTFKAGVPLVSSFDIFGPARETATGAPRVSVGYRVRRADGTAVADVEPQPLRPGARGEVSAALVFTVPAGSSGEHELVVTVRDEVAGRTIEDREIFIIE
jgi:VWFA-related protein